jgi:hypothetical protein
MAGMWDIPSVVQWAVKTALLIRVMNSLNIRDMQRKR